MDNILASIKQLVGIPEEVEDFDTQLIFYINTVFATLNQMGVGPSKTFMITDSSASTASWSDFIPDGELESVKTYMGFKVKEMFDPPTAGSANQAMDRVLKELEYRIFVIAENKKVTNDET